MTAETPSQTAGPFLHIGMMPGAIAITAQATAGPELATRDSQGQRIRVEGRIFEAAGEIVRDALVELWQADAAGRYRHPADRQNRLADPAFTGFGRCASDFGSGIWRFDTVKPGRVLGPDGRPMAPHLTLLIFARGINIHLHTRAYFADEALANAADPVLGLVDPARRATLLARAEGGEPPLYRFDIRLQGDKETVFFDG